jgi:hypothetical protein
MTQNVERVLERGERLDQLQNRSEELNLTVRFLKVFFYIFIFFFTLLVATISYYCTSGATSYVLSECKMDNYLDCCRHCRHNYYHFDYTQIGGCFQIKLNVGGCAILERS